MRHFPRLRLVHGPTPLIRPMRLSERLGVDLWIKRDDATGGVEAGNKVRKLEFLMADARAHEADTVITCGGLQSNHARATAVIAAALGLKCELYLWTPDINAPPPVSGNLFLDRLLGARIHVITLDQYRDRDAVLQRAAADIERAGGRPYVIPEGGSNGLGALGYVEAMREVRAQLDLGLGGASSFDFIVHACGSGGTAAGVALGAARFGVAHELRAFAVCNDTPYFERAIGRIIEQARELDPSLPAPVAWRVDDTAKGPAYGIADDAQRRFMIDLARLCGLVLDPVYTGKALFGLAQAVKNDGALVGKRVLFIHTGGLPGLLAQAEDFARDL